MKLHDTRPPQPARCPDAIWELIPWYVNGSLPEDEAATVAAHSETCPDCEAEIARQQVLAKKVATTDPFDAPLRGVGTACAHRSRPTPLRERRSLPNAAGLPVCTGASWP
uniref:Zf-HC2 domain-containing protein n=1 Tax=Yoonia rhodophyticola TaxID=3137370 RepID=A0AAN0MM07_9RHOB